MRHFSLVCTLLCSLFSFSQEVEMVAGTIINEETQEPIESVNIGFVGKGIGTVSNEEGSFYLVYKVSSVAEKDVLQISSIGYETKTVPFDELNQLSTHKTLVSLKPKNYALDQVVIRGIPRKKKTIGHPDVTNFDMGYWRNAEALGGEIASVIRVRKSNTRLLNLKFNIIENLSDSIKVRVNVYDYKRGIPGKNLLTQNIFHTISKKKGLETIDLEKYRINVNDDVAVSIELIEVYGTSLYFAISASAYGGQSFTREISQDDWKIYKKVGIGFSMDSSFPAKGADKEVVSRTKPEKLHVLWDTSLNLQHRNLKEELKLLKKYITGIGNVEVSASKFNQTVYDSRAFSCYNGRCDDLFDFLEESTYHGASNYEGLLREKEHIADMVMLFTDGNSFFGTLNPEINAPIFVVNSLADAAHKELQDLCIVSGGAYLDLTRLDEKIASDFLRYDINDVATYKSKDFPIDDYYYGVVYHTDSIPVGGATIRIKNKLEEAVSKSNGSYKIEAEAGDILEIEALGMYNKTITVGSVRKVHIRMEVNRELLDEVLVQNRKEKELVMTPYGMKNPDGVGFSMAQTITSDDINESMTELSQILNWGRGVNAVRIDRFGTIKYQFRKFQFASFDGSTFAAVVVDGIVYDQNIGGTRVPEINPQLIDRIVLLQSALGTSRYGSAAAYGAIVIETKDYVQFREDGDKEEEEVPSALVSGNEYEENVMTLEQASISLNEPDYLEQLEATTSFDMAKKTYFKLLPRHKNKIAFHMLAANYFENWNADFAQVVRTNILSVAPNNPQALKVLAYQLEKNNQLAEAQVIYEQIMVLNPTAAQSYRDLAQIFVMNGAYNDAASLYKQMVYNTIPNVDFIDFQDVLLTEFQHLLKTHKSKIDFDGIPSELLAVDFKRDIRLVLEWNAPGTEFDVQFVNPENKFFNFSHTYFNNKDLLKKEIADGISMKEFIIDEDAAGRWLVNISYEGQPEKSIPVVLKYTLYQNYGLPDETKTIKTIQLDQFQNKVTLDSFLNSGS